MTNEKPEEEKYESLVFSSQEEENENRFSNMREYDRLTGIEPDPEYQAYTAKLRAVGLPSEEIIKRFIEWVKSKQE